MVKALHAAGIEVIIDVVYNHTAEGNHLGPMLSMRGIDNLAYYRVTDENPLYYLDFTGTGNSLNMRNPHVLQLIMDSLRYWVTEMHVDGFRFDLASTLARELFAVDRLSAFFDLVQQDPIVSSGEADRRAVGRRRGRLPGRQLPAAVVGVERPLPRHDPRLLARRAGRAGRVRLALHRAAPTCTRPTAGDPTASINFVTAHDGFTLADLVSYNDKHNEANGETTATASRTTGRGTAAPAQDDGPTDDPAINALRARQRRNFMTTLLLSQGVPMILGGDELGRTQRGNNNAYCQDNELSWFDWEHADADVRRVVPLGHRAAPEQPRLPPPSLVPGPPDPRHRRALWLRPDGLAMSDNDWDNGYAKSLGVLLNGSAISTPDAFGGRVVDDSFLLLFNASELDLPWTLPADSLWAAAEPVDGRARHRPRARARHGVRRRFPADSGVGSTVPLRQRSVVVLRSAT